MFSRPWKSKFSDDEGKIQYQANDWFVYLTWIYFLVGRGSPCGIVANVLDCDIVVSEFKLQSCCSLSD